MLISTCSSFSCYLSFGVLGTCLSYCETPYYYVFHGCVTLFFASNSLTQCRITLKFLHNVFFRPEVIFSSQTIFINALTKVLTPTHLVTFSISRTRIRMKFLLRL